MCFHGFLAMLKSSLFFSVVYGLLKPDLVTQIHVECFFSRFRRGWRPTWVAEANNDRLCSCSEISEPRSTASTIQQAPSASLLLLCSCVERVLTTKVRTT